MKRRLLVLLLVVALLSTMLIMPANAYVSKDGKDGNWEWGYASDLWGVWIVGYTGSASNVRIPEKLSGRVVYGIEPYVFVDNTSLRKITVPDGMTIPSFGGCNVEEIVFEGTATLGNSVFANCKKLKSVKLPKELDTIPYKAFENCTSLQTVALPDTVYTIHNGAFAGCTSLKKIHIPASVDEFGYRVFAYCSNLTDLTVGKGNPILHKDSSGALYRTFYGKTELVFGSTLKGEYSVPKDVEGVDQEAFSGATKLTKVIFNADRVSITHDAFDGCTALKELVFRGTASTYGIQREYTGLTITCPVEYKHSYEREFPGATFSFYGAPTITKQPENVQAKVGEKAIFRVQTDVADASYQWQLSQNGTKWIDTGETGNKTPELKVSVTEAKFGRMFRCVVTDNFSGKQTVSEAAVLELKKTNATILEQPQDGYAQLDKTVMTEVKAEGDGLTYQWYFKNPGDEAFRLSSVNKAKYSTTMNAASRDRQVYCVLTDEYGNSVQTQTVNFRLAATITQQPKSLAVQEGEVARAKVEAIGDGLSYQWYIKNATGSKFSKSSVTTAEYACKMSEAANGRQAYCIVTDQYGNQTKSETVTLFLGESVQIIEQPQSVAVGDGAVVRARVKATGDGLTYQWYIKNAGQTKFSKSSVTTAEYACKMSEATNGRQAYCVITDQFGISVQTETVTFHMGDGAKITQQPKPAAVQEGVVAKTKVVATGEGLTYQWYIKNAGQTKFSKSSVTTAEYACKMNEKANGREVYCVVTDCYGSTVKSQVVTLYMGNAAEIVSQPQAAAAQDGAVIKTTVEATGDGLSYQWYIKNATGSKFSKSSVTGATYSCKMSEAADGREVYCVITDRYGISVQSATVTLTMEH